MNTDKPPIRRSGMKLLAELPEGYEDCALAVLADGTVMLAHPDREPMMLLPGAKDFVPVRLEKK